MVQVEEFLVLGNFAIWKFCLNFGIFASCVGIFTICLGIFAICLSLHGVECGYEFDKLPRMECNISQI